MADIFRDSPFGQIVRLVTKKRYFKYAEERDPSIWKRYLSVEKSRKMALHGTLSKRDSSGAADRLEKPLENDSSQGTSPSRTSEELQEGIAGGVAVDPEHGRDIHIVDWFSADDPENPMNWSTFKKVFVTFQICLLTFSVYIGSAIYSAGIEDVVREFSVSRVASTLGTVGLFQ